MKLFIILALSIGFGVSALSLGHSTKSTATTFACPDCGPTPTCNPNDPHCTE